MGYSATAFELVGGHVFDKQVVGNDVQAAVLLQRTAYEGLI